MYIWILLLCAGEFFAGWLCFTIGQGYALGRLGITIEEYEKRLDDLKKR